MQSALAKVDGIETSDCDVNYDTKVVTVNVADANVKPEDLVKAFEGTQYSATVN